MDYSELLNNGVKLCAFITFIFSIYLKVVLNDIDESIWFMGLAIFGHVITMDD